MHRDVIKHRVTEVLVEVCNGGDEVRVEGNAVDATVIAENRCIGIAGTYCQAVLVVMGNSFAVLVIRWSTNRNPRISAVG